MSLRHSQQSLLWEASYCNDLDQFISTITYVPVTIVCHVRNEVQPGSRNIKESIRQLIDVSSINLTPLEKFTQRIITDNSTAAMDFTIPFDERFSTISVCKEKNFVWLLRIKASRNYSSLSVAISAYMIDVSSLYTFSAISATTVLEEQVGKKEVQEQTEKQDEEQWELELPVSALSLEEKKTQ